jgi:hypothetical protein
MAHYQTGLANHVNRLQRQPAIASMRRNKIFTMLAAGTGLEPVAAAALVRSVAEYWRIGQAAEGLKYHRSMVRAQRLRTPCGLNNPSAAVRLMRQYGGEPTFSPSGIFQQAESAKGRQTAM